ncbi:hypothetical protein FKW77_006948 [Venturia effusa]|uniref:non-specific serine/threonine protein kinase n=1 Tax=Venturia effusa TaxID=50376 RepID=A0A517LCL2_9PEZI|nr:hypothetical protein FKW77_006948 [Venturia effusa]
MVRTRAAASKAKAKDKEPTASSSVPEAMSSETKEQRNERVARMIMIDLRAYAKANGVQFKSKDSKSILQEKVRNHLAAVDEAEAAEEEEEEGEGEGEGVQGEDEPRIESPTNQDDIVTTDNFRRRERAVAEREKRVMAREQEYLNSREAAVEARERAIQEREYGVAQKRSLTEADPEHDLHGPRPQKRRRVALEEEQAIEMTKDLPRPTVPEFLERKGSMRLQRDGKDFRTKRGTHVKQWYDAGLVLDSTTDNERWIYKKGVGEGAYGSCSIWVRANDKVITDRVVVKDQIIDEQSLNWLMWTFDGFQDKPLEADLQRRLWERNPRCFVGYRGFSYNKDDHVFKLFTEYARYGNLKGLIDKWAKSAGTYKKAECIPEPFIWYVARELLLAAKTMATGFRSKDSTTENNHQDGEWVEIVHMDIKPDNVLMADPDPESEDEKARVYQWPRIQVTDFGVAVELQPQWQNPQDLTGRGTQGYMAPEQYRQIGRNPMEYPIQRLSAKTNVWGISAVLYDLMNPRVSKGRNDGTGGPVLDTNSKVQDSRIGYQRDLIFDVERKLKWRMKTADEESHTNRSRPPDDELSNVYSEPLIELVTQCLAFKPEDRMDLQEMESIIEDNLGSWDDSSDPEWSGNVNLDFESKILKLDGKRTPMEDEFAIGSRRASVGAANKI